MRSNSPYAKPQTHYMSINLYQQKLASLRQDLLTKQSEFMKKKQVYEQIISTLQDQNKRLKQLITISQSGKGVTDAYDESNRNGSQANLHNLLSHNIQGQISSEKNLRNVSNRNHHFNQQQGLYIENSPNRTNKLLDQNQIHISISNDNNNRNKSQESNTAKKGYVGVEQRSRQPICKNMGIQNMYFTLGNKSKESEPIITINNRPHYPGNNKGRQQQTNLKKNNQQQQGGLQESILEKYYAQSPSNDRQMHEDGSEEKIEQPATDQLPSFSQCSRADYEQSFMPRLKTNTDHSIQQLTRQNYILRQQITHLTDTYQRQLQQLAFYFDKIKSRQQQTANKTRNHTEQNPHVNSNIRAVQAHCQGQIKAALKVNIEITQDFGRERLSYIEKIIELDHYLKVAKERAKNLKEYVWQVESQLQMLREENKLLCQTV